MEENEPPSSPVKHSASGCHGVDTERGALLKLCSLPCAGCRLDALHCASVSPLANKGLLFPEAVPALRPCPVKHPCVCAASSFPSPLLVRCWGQQERLTWCSVFQEALAAISITGSCGACPEDQLCWPGSHGMGSCPQRGSGKMSGGTAHLLTALFMAVTAVIGYPSRRSATDLDATPRTTVTFEGKRVWVLVVAVRILPALDLVHCDCEQTSQAPGVWGSAWRVATGGLWSPAVRARMAR